MGGAREIARVGIGVLCSPKPLFESCVASDFCKILEFSATGLKVLGDFCVIFIFEGRSVPRV
jgi:hypothetical protein